jgi:hypothetical protein
MNDEDAVIAYLDSIGEEYKAKFIQPGEFTIGMLVESQNINWQVAKGIVNDMEKKGKITKRKGMSEKGRSCDIYKPV